MGVSRQGLGYSHAGPHRASLALDKKIHSHVHVTSLLQYASLLRCPTTGWAARAPGRAGVKAAVPGCFFSSSSFLFNPPPKPLPRLVDVMLSWKSMAAAFPAASCGSWLDPSPPAKRFQARWTRAIARPGSTRRVKRHWQRKASCCTFVHVVPRHGSYDLRIAFRFKSSRSRVPACGNSPASLAVGKRISLGAVQSLKDL